MIDFINYIMIKLKKIKNKFLRLNFKKYIIKYEEIGDKIKITNSSYEYKYVDNSIHNKIKISR